MYPPLNLYVAACPDNMVRFGEYCYIDLGDMALAESLDACSGEGSDLWWPETELEMKFVTEMFNASAFHLGIRSYHEREGVEYTDGSFGTGIQFVTSTILSSHFEHILTSFTPRSGDFDAQSNLASGSYDPDSQCLRYRGSPWQLVSDPACPEARAICKSKLALGTGYNSIIHSVQYRMRTSLRSANPRNVTGTIRETCLQYPYISGCDRISGTNPIHIELIFDPYVPRKYVEIVFSAQVVFSGLKLETLRGAPANEFHVFVVGKPNLTPDAFEEVVTKALEPKVTSWKL